MSHLSLPPGRSNCRQLQGYLVGTFLLNADTTAINLVCNCCPSLRLEVFIVSVKGPMIIGRRTYRSLLNRMRAEFH